MKLCSFLFLVVLLASGQAAKADPFSDASTAFCERMKSCAAEDMGDLEEMSDEMKAQLMASFDGLCAEIQVSFEKVRLFSDLVDSATQCLSSMAQMSCDALDTVQDEDATPQCKAYRLEAAKYE